MTTSGMTTAVLAAFCVCTAVAVVYTKHLSRQAYADISASQRLIDELDVRWSQLQIEESTFSGYARIERTATERLGMHLPSRNESVMIVRQPAQVTP